MRLGPGSPFPTSRPARGLVAVVLASVWVASVVAQQPPDPPVDHADGPLVGDLGGIAQIELPEGFRFADGQETRVRLEAMQNATSGDELGMVIPTADDANWFVLFEFSEVGYVEDGERDELDADAMLKTIRDGNRHANEERKERGWAPLEITDWEQPPRYDSRTHNLEWAVRGESEGEAIVNYNTRLFGRRGVMEVALVGNPYEVQSVLPALKFLLEGFSFTPGHRYAEFQPGDKAATYGLAALVTGGTAAAAIESGVLQRLWKFIVAGVLAVGVAWKKLFAKGQAA